LFFFPRVFFRPHEHSISSLTVLTVLSVQAFKQFGPIQIEWPGKDTSPSPPKVKIAGFLSLLSEIDVAPESIIFLHLCKSLKPTFTTMNMGRLLWWRIYICDWSLFFFTWALDPGESTSGRLRQRLGTPILQQGELQSCPGERIYAAVQVDPL
jgi:hypothetical protein